MCAKLEVSVQSSIACKYLSYLNTLNLFLSNVLSYVFEKPNLTTKPNNSDYLVNDIYDAIYSFYQNNQISPISIKRKNRDITFHLNSFSTFSDILVSLAQGLAAH